jgi:quercetin dioxygenase-like cupin family protein
VFAQTGLRIFRYQAHTEMTPHQHDEASMNIVVAGEFLERIGRDERTYTRGTASFCPAATTHSQKFGATGVRQIIFKPHDSCRSPWRRSRVQQDVTRFISRGNSVASSESQWAPI